VCPAYAPFAFLRPARAHTRLWHTFGTAWYTFGTACQLRRVAQPGQWLPSYHPTRYAAWLTLLNGTHRAPGYPRHILPDSDRCSFARAGRAEMAPCVARWRGVFAEEVSQCSYLVTALLSVVTRSLRN
jgi:hypothetical protein